jgi:hypothetical protein
MGLDAQGNACPCSPNDRLAESRNEGRLAINGLVTMWFLASKGNWPVAKKRVSRELNLVISVAACSGGQLVVSKASEAQDVRPKGPTRKSRITGGKMKETPQEYIKRILGLVESQDALKVQTGTAKKLERLIKGQAASKLRKRRAPEKWSVGEILAHLADMEIVTGWRMRQILGSPGTTVQAFDQDSWAVACHYDKRDPHKAAEQFRVQREANLALLKSLAPKQWGHYGMHAERGKETIKHMVRLQAGHDLNHIRQIEAILAVRRRKHV